MGSDRRVEANRVAREHLERTRARLARGRENLKRIHESIDDTNKHLESISEWIAETERTLAQERNELRSPGEKPYSWKTGSR